MRKIRLSQFLLMLVGALVLAVCYQVELWPLRGDQKIPVPLGVGVGILIAFLYPHPLGWWTILLYFVLGILGLPVFPSSQAGLEALKGMHGAFVWGLAPMTWVVTDLVRKRWNEQFWTILVSMFVAAMTMFAVAFGVVYLIFSLDRAFTWIFLEQIPSFFILGFGCTITAFAVWKSKLGRH